MAEFVEHLAHGLSLREWMDLQYATNPGLKERVDEMVKEMEAEMEAEAHG